MVSSKPQALLLSLALYITLALVSATLSDAKGSAPILVHRRDHYHPNHFVQQQPNNIGIFPTATNSEFMMPVYPSTVSYLDAALLIQTIFLTRSY